MLHAQCSTDCKSYDQEYGNKLELINLTQKHKSRTDLSQAGNSALISVLHIQMLISFSFCFDRSRRVYYKKSTTSNLTFRSQCFCIFPFPYGHKGQTPLEQATLATIPFFSLVSAFYLGNQVDHQTTVTFILYLTAYISCLS